MSRCAHERSEFQLRKLPRCTKCKAEFVLVLAHYENAAQASWEWECTKCHKTVPVNMLNEEPASPEDVKLHEWCINDQKERARRKNSSRPSNRNKLREFKSCGTH